MPVAIQNPNAVWNWSVLLLSDKWRQINIMSSFPWMGLSVSSGAENCRQHRCGGNEYCLVVRPDVTSYCSVTCVTLAGRGIWNCIPKHALHVNHNQISTLSCIHIHLSAFYVLYYLNTIGFFNLPAHVISQFHHFSVL